jgi:Alpha amylase, catalytic domain
MAVDYPLLYQVNSRVWVTELSAELGRPATLDDIPDTALSWFAETGFDWVWFLGVWQTGDAGQQVSRTHRAWKEAFRHALADLDDTDICGSCFAIRDYVVDARLGGPKALARLRARMQTHGLKLMLDFVPNHVAPDHPWIDHHPDYFISGDNESIEAEPQNYIRVDTANGPAVFAYGRDPYFPGWPDTLQLDYANRDLQSAMRDELAAIARQCDGVRCDMAMLVLPEVFHHTWKRRAEPFWPDAVAYARQQAPGFVFLAEVYWDKEWELQQQGFDYAYDKRLYDRLRDQDPGPLRGHLSASLDYQNKLARFLENHDEPRAAATFPPAVHKAAAIITYFAPGLRFFHQGQFEGKTTHLPVHLCRAPTEEKSADLGEFYRCLMPILASPAVRAGSWRLLDCRPSWEGDTGFHAYIAYAIEDATGTQLVVVVNYGPIEAQSRISLHFQNLAGSQWRLVDLLNGNEFDRDGNELSSIGLYVDLPPWGYHVFDVKKT